MRKRSLMKYVALSIAAGMLITATPGVTYAHEYDSDEAIVAEAEDEKVFVDAVTVNGNECKPVPGETVGDYVSRIQLTSSTPEAIKEVDMFCVKAETDEMLYDNDVFEAGTEYKLMIRVDANEGYGFKSADGEKTTVNMTDFASVVVRSNEYENYIGIESTPFAVENKMVAMITVNGNECKPVPGETVGDYVSRIQLTSSTPEAIKEVDMFCVKAETDEMLYDNDVFEAGTEYKLMIRVDANEGYGFKSADGEKTTVNMTDFASVVVRSNEYENYIGIESMPFSIIAEDSKIQDDAITEETTEDVTTENMTTEETTEDVTTEVTTEEENVDDSDKKPAKPPVKEPAKPPVKEPAKPPVKEPAKPPVKEPAKPPVKNPAKPSVNTPVNHLNNSMLFRLNVCNYKGFLYYVVCGPVVKDAHVMGFPCFTNGNK